MSRHMTRFLSLIITVTLLLSVALSVQAETTVSYDKNARKFVFAPDNLFSAFQSVMPGDVLTEEILIKNDVSNNVKIKVYLRSHGAQNGTDDFLSQMKLKVKGPRRSAPLFNAPANETAGLTDWVYLGTVYSGGDITLNLTLEVPASMGDDYQDQLGYIHWEFMVEVFPVDPSDPKPPQTGDESDFFLYAGLMTVSFAALVVLLFVQKRRKQENSV